VTSSRPLPSMNTAQIMSFSMSARLGQRVPTATAPARRGVIARFANDSSGAKAKVAFTLPYHVEFGQEVAVVGEIDTLGACFAARAAGGDGGGWLAAGVCGRNWRLQCDCPADTIRQHTTSSMHAAHAAHTTLVGSWSWPTNAQHLSAALSLPQLSQPSPAPSSPSSPTPCTNTHRQVGRRRRHPPHLDRRRRLDCRH